MRDKDNVVRTAPAELFLLSAESARELVERCRRLAWTGPLAETPAGPFADVARHSQAGFGVDATHRLAVVAADAADLRRKLVQVAATIERAAGIGFWGPTGIHYGVGLASPGGVAFVFPGQGSQYVGMGADVARLFPQARAAWDDVATLTFEGRTLPEVVFPVAAATDEERAAQAACLAATEWAQPALAVQSLALLAVLRSAGLRPDCLAGHSFGELTALHASGSFDAAALIGLARRRGELMRDMATEPGAMLAVPASLTQVESLFARLGLDGVWVANHNSPRQVVVSGAVAAVDRVQAELAAVGIAARRLSVSTVCHTPLAAPAREPLLEYLRGMDIRAPWTEVFANVEARGYAADPGEVRRGLADQLHSRVRFVEEIEAMYAQGARTFVEVGAGSVLTGLVGQILVGRPHLAVSVDRKGHDGVTTLYDALGRLAVAGVRLDLAALRAPSAPPAPRTPAPRTPAPRTSTARTAAPSTMVGTERLVRLVVRTVDVPEPGLPLAGLGRSPVAVIDDGGGVAAAVVAGLARHGVAARVVTGLPDPTDSVVFLGGLRTVSSVEAAAALNHQALRAARAVAAHQQANGGVFVTVQDTGGTFGLAGAPPLREWSGGIAALARTAAREWPLTAVKAIDCERAGRDPQAIAGALVRELVRGGSTVDIGLTAAGRRLTLAPDPAAPGDGAAGPSAGLGTGSVIVVSGGARGVAAAALLALARRHRPRLVLLGRTRLVDEAPALRAARDERSLQQALIEQARQRGETPSPGRIRAEVAAIRAAREVRGTLAALERAGSPVRYVRVDVRDAAAVAHALADVRRTWGAITGVVHASGVPADLTLADAVDEPHEQVFSTKVDGLRALLAATEGDPLRLLVLFSNTGAQAGSAGQSANAMANAVLDQVASAQALRRPGCLVRAIAWGPWCGGMVGPELAEHLHRQGVPMIPVDAGADAFVAELESGGAPRVIVSATGGARQLAVATGHLALGVTLGRAQPYLADHALAGAPVVPVALAAEWLAQASCRERTQAGPLVLRDIRVLRAICMAGFPDPPQRLHVRSRLNFAKGTTALGLEIRAEDGTPHYRASADLGPQSSVVELWQEPAGLAPLGRAQPYDGHALFHGPRFQAIRTVEGVSAAGAAAAVVGVRELGWADEDWCTDPGVVDAGLQLAMLWGEWVLGGACLPIAIREYRIWRRGARGRSRPLPGPPSRRVWRAGRVRRRVLRRGRDAAGRAAGGGTGAAPGQPATTPGHIYLGKLDAGDTHAGTLSRLFRQMARSADHGRQTAGTYTFRAGQLPGPVHINPQWPTMRW